jgi:AGCS family alanine or glycine:cation symporter
LAAIAVVGIGCLVQANSVVDAIVEYYPFNRAVLGIILAVFTGLVIIGGVKNIGLVAGVLVPFMALSYLLFGLIVIAVNYLEIPAAILLIFKQALVPQAVAGGLLGSSIMLAMQNGAQFGIFANEAGLGSLAIAASSAKTNCAVEQGMRSIAGVFLATMIICTITGLVLAVTQVVGIKAIDGSMLKGSSLVMQAFGSVHPHFRLVVLLSLTMFAFTTMLAWSYYGEKAFEFLFGAKTAIFYRWAFTLCVLFGAILELDIVWAIANISTAIMVLPNLYAITSLSKEIKFELRAATR